MTTRIAFLRAVNLGKRTVKMARIVEIVERLGYEQVWTHINSGNVVFDAAGTRAAIERGLEAKFEGAFGFEVTTFVRTAAELRRAIGVEPFSVGTGDTYFVTLLKSAPRPHRSAPSSDSRTNSTPSWSTAETCIGGCTASRPTRG